MTRHRPLLTAGMLAAFALLTAEFSVAQSVPAAVSAAVNDAGRPAADKERDALRKPAEVVAFAGIKAGDRVAELIPGGGYFTRIFSKVVGAKGKVYAVATPPRANAPEGSPEPSAPVKEIAADAQYSNVSVLVEPMTRISVPEPVDVVWTSQNYHDIHNVQGADLAAINKAVFDALKPGGIYLVLDHSAAAGSGFRDTSTLHRIDAEAVKKEILAAGFVLDGQSELLKNAADDRSGKVFDPAIRGKTDQFILKFRKPAK